MRKTPESSLFPYTRFVLLALFSMTLVVSGCSSDSDDVSFDNNTAVPVIDASVSAIDGGVFTSDDGRVSIEIPPAALAEDSAVQVTPAEGLVNSTGTMSSAGDAFDVSIGTELLVPAVIRVVIDTPPTHPELAETAMVTDGEWVRSRANFFLPSDNTVISLVDASGVLQPVFRRLQASSGDQVIRGQEVFLEATFGNEQFFGEVIGLQEVLNNINPTMAVSVGAQVDIDRVPSDIAAVLSGNDFAAKQAALESNNVTRALLQADAVVGVRAFYDNPESNAATSIGLTCALCHTTVTPTEFELSEGNLVELPIGPLNLDGAPNTNMDAGTILSLTPFAMNAGADTVAFLQGFGAGQFDARALPDNPIDDGVNNPTSIPPIWNFLDLDEQNYTYNWDGFFGSTEDPDNALASRDELVFDLVLHANGAFGTTSSSVPLAAAAAPPADLVNALVAAEDAAPGNDIDQQSLLDLQEWERSRVSPAPGVFDEAQAEVGFRLFHGEAQCSSCHLSAEFTGPVKSTNIVFEPPQGGLAGGIKTPGLRGIRLTAPYFHDGSAETLEDAVAVYSGRIVPELNAEHISAIAEYLRSL